MMYTFHNQVFHLYVTVCNMAEKIDNKLSQLDGFHLRIAKCTTAPLDIDAVVVNCFLHHFLALTFDHSSNIVSRTALIQNSQTR